jgi:hypothetical protein
MKVIYAATIDGIEETGEAEQALCDLAENDVLKGAITMALDMSGLDGEVVGLTATIDVTEREGRSAVNIDSDRITPPLRYFAWDDDVVIPFSLNALGERVVTAESAIDMVRSIIWNHDHPEANQLDLSPGDVLSDIVHLLERISEDEPATVILPDYGIDLCDAEGRAL